MKTILAIGGHDPSGGAGIQADIESIAQSEGDRGELTYSRVEVRALGDGHALAYGMRRLAFKDGSSMETWFSTVYADTPFGWKAILTHQ